MEFKNNKKINSKDRHASRNMNFHQWKHIWKLMTLFTIKDQWLVASNGENISKNVPIIDQ